MSHSELLLPTYQNMLQALSAWIEKAESRHADGDPDTLLAARLAPDMYSLTTQVRFACYQAQEVRYRLRGEAIPETVSNIAKEGREGGDTPGTMADARAEIERALAFLDALEKDDLDINTVETVTLDLPNGLIFDMSPAQFVRDWALPQFYFHVMTAYAILRSSGIDLGKADYVAHMFAYLRPGTAPQAEA